jgi:hypothetical protein
LPVHTLEFCAGQINCCEAEPAIATDPLPNLHRIDIPERSCGRIINDLIAEEARAPAGMKAKHRILRNTDPIMRHNAEHERTGRRTDAIDNDLFAGIAKGHVARPIGADIAAAIIGYANNGAGAFRKEQDENQSERYCECGAQAQEKSTVAEQAGDQIQWRGSIYGTA